MKKPIVVSIVNHKGGVGKTTSVINLSAVIADSPKLRKIKKKVLVIDFDHQANATLVLYRKCDGESSIYHKLLEYSGITITHDSQEYPMDVLVKPSTIENVDIFEKTAAGGDNFFREFLKTRRRGRKN